MKRYLSAFLVIMISFVATSSLLLSFDEDDKENLAKLHEAMTKFREETVKPQFLAWKSLIDENISAEDLAKLDALRERNAELMKKHREFMLKVKRQIAAGEDVDRDRVREEMKRFRDAKMAIMKQVREIHANNSEFLARFREQVKETHEQWAKEREAIFERWCAEYPELCEQMKDRRHKRGDISEDKRRDGKKGEGKNGEGRRGGKGMHGGEKGNCMNPDFNFGECGNFAGKGNMQGGQLGNIFLFNGEFPEVEAVESGSLAGMMELDNSEIMLKNSPNPVNGSTMISFTLQNSSRVELTVSDFLGATVATVFEGNLNAGSHEFEFDPAKYNLSSGTYMYKIWTDTGFKSGKMIVQ